MLGAHGVQASLCSDAQYGPQKGLLHAVCMHIVYAILVDKITSGFLSSVLFFKKQETSLYSTLEGFIGLFFCFGFWGIFCIYVGFFSYKDHITTGEGLGRQVKLQQMSFVQQYLYNSICMIKRVCNSRFFMKPDMLENTFWFFFFSLLKMIPFPGFGYKASRFISLLHQLSSYASGRKDLCLSSGWFVGYHR